MEARYVCDRCKKEVTDFLKMQTVHVGTSGILVHGSYLLCNKCAEDFTDRFIDGYQPESEEVKEERSPVTISITDDEIFNSEKAMEIVKQWDKRR